MVAKLNSQFTGSPDRIVSDAAESGPRMDTTARVLHQDEKAQGSPLYRQLKALEKKSALELNKLLGKWLADSAGDDKGRLASPGLINPILKKYIDNNYLPPPDESTPHAQLTPRKEKTDLLSKGERLYSVEEQKIFLENEFALAAALDGLDDEFFFTFVRECTESKDGDPPASVSPSAHADAINKSVCQAITQGDTGMLSTMLEDFDAQIKTIDETTGVLKARLRGLESRGIAAAEEAAAEAGAVAGNELPADVDALEARFKARIIDLDKRRANLVTGQKEIRTFLEGSPAINTASATTMASTTGATSTAHTPIAPAGQ